MTDHSEEAIAHEGVTIGYLWRDRLESGLWFARPVGSRIAHVWQTRDEAIADLRQRYARHLDPDTTDAARE